MKKNILSAAIAVITMSAFSQASFALDATVTPDLQVYLSGASAQDKGIDSLVKDLCLNGTVSTTDLTTFKDDGGVANAVTGKKHTAWFCTITSTSVTGLSATKKVLFHKRSDGGSAMGVSPLLADTAIDHMVINNSNCATTGTTRSCRISNAGDLVAHKSDAGLSDVNPEMFKGILNTPAGFSSVKASDVTAKLVVRPSSAVIFGVPVGLNLYKALQQAQGLLTTSNPAGACTEGAYTDACMPNLNHAQVASLLSGQIKDWSELSFGGTALTAIAGVTAPTDSLVHICKRTAGSGTGAQMYAKFLNAPCTEGTLTVSAGDPFNGPVVHEVAESLDLENCQEDLALGNVVAKDFNGDLINQGAQGDTAWSIGMQALEKNSDIAKAYRFVKIDGAAPTLANAFNGSYSDWVEATWQYRNTANSGPAGDTLKIVDKIIKNAGSPAKLNSLLNKTQPFGRTGYLAVAANGFAVTDTLDPALPVMPFTHAAAGSLNNCAAPAKSSSAAVISVK
ncbi:MAG: hypothetical protein WCP01_02390 [Methylococcaceae bacterium]